MTNLPKSLSIAWVLYVALTVSAHATEIIHYKNIPITIHLQTGQERNIEFGDHVRVGVTEGQRRKGLFRVQSAQGVVHIKPSRPFDKTRVLISRLTDKRVILVDFIATNPVEGEPPLEPVMVILDFENKVTNSQVKSKSDYAEINVLTPVDLTRYASQHLYGPTRLHNAVRGITKARVGVKGAIKIFKGKNKLTTVSVPIVAYRGGGHYLAGILINNISEKRVQLDYLDLNLPFSHATFQHHVLAPKGKPGDSTVLYLASEKPLKDTLYPWTYYQDKKEEAITIAKNIQKDGDKEEASKRRTQSRK